MAFTIQSLVIFLFLVLGIQFFRGKWLFLVAGYNMMDNKKKSSVDKTTLSSVVGTFCLIVAFLQFINVLFPATTFAVTCLIFFFLIITVLLANTVAMK